MGNLWKGSITYIHQQQFQQTKQFKWLRIAHVSSEPTTTTQCLTGRGPMNSPLRQIHGLNGIVGW